MRRPRNFYHQEVDETKLNTMVERINDRGQHPNPLIYFIKPLSFLHRPKRDIERADSTLNRLAAVVYPIMKANGLKVKALAEHEYNSLFLGRNFNAGELVELVLKNRVGEWLPERFVLSVLLHELSHCTNMHHAAPFWATLSTYKLQMEQLLSKGYTGEGFWSRGKSLDLNVNIVAAASVDEADLPEHLCGGSHRRSRSAKHSRRYRRGKFENAGDGVKMGGDTDQRIVLEKGKKVKGNPRVAQSKRGKDLRLEAALARMKAPPILATANLTDLNMEREDDQSGDDDDVVFIEEFELDDFELLHRFRDEDMKTRLQLEKEWKEIGGAFVKREKKMSLAHEVIVID